MGFAISDGHEGREKTIMVETDMEFDGGFCCAELRSGEAAQAQVNGGSVKGIQLVFKAEAVARGARTWHRDRNLANRFSYSEQGCLSLTLGKDE